MTRTFSRDAARRWTALTLVASLLLPGLAGCGSKGGDTSGSNTMSGPVAQTMPPPQPAPAKPGLSTKQKVVLLAGAALLFYLYKKDVANNQAAANANGPGGKPQLYREEKGPNAGAIYYRDPQTHKPIWVTAPNGGVNVPADQDALAAQQQYGSQPAPAVPQGAQTVPATQYDPSLSGANG